MAPDRTITVLAVGLFTAGLAGGMSLSKRLERAHLGTLEERRAALPELSNPFGVPLAARVVIEDPSERFRRATGWKRNVVATVFWVGEDASSNNPVHNKASAWDGNWEANFGGLDDPDARDGYGPAGFEPKMNPFYVALPYNDIGKDGLHRPEASEVIPWFWEDYRGDGISVCKGRWVAIHARGGVCYAQWEDVGPFEVDHWQYVFGGEAPRANLNNAAGIDVSPAVRDFLGLKSGERVQWRFVNERDVAAGPWAKWKGTREAGERGLPWVEPPLPSY
jgi:hypothetical protein